MAVAGTPNSFVSAPVILLAKKGVSLKHFFVGSYTISLLKNEFVTLLFIQFSAKFQKITLISSRIGRFKICALLLGFLYPKRVKKTKTQLQTTKIAKFSVDTRKNQPLYLEIKLRYHVYHETKPFIINTV